MKIIFISVSRSWAKDMTTQCAGSALLCTVFSSTKRGSQLLLDASGKITHWDCQVAGSLHQYPKQHLLESRRRRNTVRFLDKYLLWDVEHSACHRGTWADANHTGTHTWFEENSKECTPYLQWSQGTLYVAWFFLRYNDSDLSKSDEQISNEVFCYWKCLRRVRPPK